MATRNAVIRTVRRWLQGWAIVDLLVLGGGLVAARIYFTEWPHHQQNPDPWFELWPDIAIELIGAWLSVRIIDDLIGRRDRRSRRRWRMAGILVYQRRLCRNLARQPYEFDLTDLEDELRHYREPANASDRKRHLDASEIHDVERASTLVENVVRVASDYFRTRDQADKAAFDAPSRTALEEAEKKARGLLATAASTAADALTSSWRRMSSQGNGLAPNSDAVNRRVLMRQIYCSRLVGTTAWKNASHKDGTLFFLREEHAPVADAQSKNLALGPLKASNISLLTHGQSLKRSHDALTRATVETCNVFEGTVCPAELERQAPPRRRRRASSWVTKRPSAKSSSASARAASSAAVRGSSSTGASLKDQRGASSSIPRCSRKCRATGSSSSGRVSINVWRRSRSCIVISILPRIPNQGNAGPCWRSGLVPGQSRAHHHFLNVAAGAVNPRWSEPADAVRSAFWALADTRPTCDHSTSASQSTLQVSKSAPCGLRDASLGPAGASGV
jgi:hypothetical protein